MAAKVLRTYKNRPIEKAIDIYPVELMGILTGVEQGKFRGGPYFNLINSLNDEEKEKIRQNYRNLQVKERGGSITGDKKDVRITTTNNPDNKSEININFCGVELGDCEKIANNIKTQSNALSKNIKISKLKGCLTCVVDFSNVDKWISNDFEIIKSVLNNSGIYDEETLIHLDDEIYSRIGHGTPESQKYDDFEKMEKDAISVWKEYLKNLHDPEVVKLIEMYSAFEVDRIYGHRLSISNSMLIRSVNNNATFILPVNEWHKLNRGVKRGARRYVVWVPVKHANRRDKQIVASAIKELGWGEIPYGDLPPQVRRKVNIHTNGVAQTVFTPVYEYDIVDTYLYKGKEDLFNTTIGLKNNLTGQLNDKAIEDARERGGKIPQDEGVEERTIRANDIMIKYCKNTGVKYVPSDKPSTNLVNMLLAKYRKDAETLKILRDENKDNFAKNATHLTLIIGRFALDKLNIFSHSHDYDDMEVQQIINSVATVITYIENKTNGIKESVENNYNELRKKILDAFFDIGCTINGKGRPKKLDENKLRCMVRECIANVFNNILHEDKILIDNFDKVKNILKFDDSDKFYFVQIIKRFKDNPNMDKSGNYHAGGEYLDSWKIFSYDELDALKPEIIRLCTKYNARAYITINPRSNIQIKSYLSTFRKRFKPTDPRYIHAEEILAGQTKSHWDDRPVLFLDIDTKDKNVWDGVDDILNRFNITELFRYTTPSGGLHIVLPDKASVYMRDVKHLLSKFDNYRNKGRLATVHPNEDGKIILYSNVNTKGY